MAPQNTIFSHMKRICWSPKISPYYNPIRLSIIDKKQILVTLTTAVIEKVCMVDVGIIERSFGNRNRLRKTAS